MKKNLILVVLIAFSMLLPTFAQTLSITAVPSSATTNQVVTLIGLGDAEQNFTWSLSGGEWCLFDDCFWRSDAALITQSGQNPLWMASTAGTYTITLTTPAGLSATVTIVVTAP